MAKRSKRMRAMAENAPGKQPLSLKEAVKVLKGFNTTKFDQSVEIAMRLGINPKQADQMVRGSIVLPHGIGKTVRVAVFAKGDKIDEAKAAGADVVGGPELAAEIKAGNINFDVCIATPDMMGVVGPLGRILGPRGLMPAPRNGTVTMEVAKVINEYKAGKVEFRNDSGGNVQAIVGKLSFTEEQLAENIQKFIDYVQSLKPSTAKGQYVKGTVISATMSPGVRVQQL
ncbi:MAG: 50S ribosomal protein L1 [Thermoguttaceae bacterium]|nr:50S ribosomal protein L1 [Thermoguttaceae bacterium]